MKTTAIQLQSTREVGPKATARTLPKRRPGARAWVRALMAMAATGFFLSASAASPEPDGAAVRFAPEKDYGPFVFMAPDGQPRGLSVDILNALLPSLDLAITTAPAGTLADILAAAQRGEVDLISSVRPTPERERYLAFTTPYVQVPAVLVVRQNTTGASLAKMAGQAVAVGKGYAVEAVMRERYPQVHWHATPDDLSALQGLLQGRYAAVVADVASVSHVLRTRHMGGLQVAQAVGFDYPLSFAYRKELAGLGQQLDAALARLDPQVRQQIVRSWIDADTLNYEDPQQTLLRQWGLGLGALALVAIGGSLWRQQTRKPGNK